MAKLIAKTYGGALFELAVEKDRAEGFLHEFDAICQAIMANPDFLRLMVHPKITGEDKVRVLEDVFKGRVSDEMVGFLELLIVKDRFGEIAAIFDYFAAAVKDSLGIGVAYVTTAQSLGEIQKSQVIDRLLAVTEYREMDTHFAVDEGLIGGMVIRIGDRVVDSSVRTHLDKMRKQLLVG